VADYDAAVGRAPDNLALRYNRAMALVDLGRHDRAIRDLNVILRRSAQDRDALTLKGEAYAGLKDFARAVDYYDAALAIDPKFERALKMRAQARAETTAAAGGAAGPKR